MHFTLFVFALPILCHSEDFIITGLFNIDTPEEMALAKINPVTTSVIDSLKIGIELTHFFVSSINTTNEDCIFLLFRGTTQELVGFDCNSFIKVYSQKWDFFPWDLHYEPKKRIFYAIDTSHGNQIVTVNENGKREEVIITLPDLCALSFEGSCYSSGNFFIGCDSLFGDKYYYHVDIFNNKTEKILVDDILDNVQVSEDLQFLYGFKRGDKYLKRINTQIQKSKIENYIEIEGIQKSWSYTFSSTVSQKRVFVEIIDENKRKWHLVFDTENEELIEKVSTQNQYKFSHYVR